MKKLIKILLILAAVVVALVVAGVLYVNHLVQTPEFKNQLLSAARETLGAEVTVSDMKVSLRSGVMLQGVAIANPEGFPGNLLEAQAFVLRYQLWPLLRRRVVIETLSIQEPVISLTRNDRGEWNYEKIGGASTPPTAPTGTPSSGTAVPLNIVLSRIALEDGRVSVLGDQGKALLALNQMNFASAVQYAGGTLAGQGHARIGSVDVAQSLFVRNLAAPVNISTAEIKLAPLSGTVAGGTIGGDLGLQLSGRFQYRVNCDIQGAQMEKLLEEAGVTKRVLQGGRLQVATHLTGTGGLPTIAGNGKAEIVGGQLVDFPALSLVATLLQIKELQQLRFDECLVEFSITNNVMTTAPIRITAPKIQITGQGTVSLEDYSLDHLLTLAVDQSLLADLPKEVRALFTPRADGYLTLDFKVTGPYDAPKTDLKERLIGGATKQLIDKGLQKLFQ